MLKKLLDIFKTKDVKNSIILKELKDADLFDTVWIVDKSGTIYEGWIYDKTRKHIIVTVPVEQGEYQDYRFIISKSNRFDTTIEQNHNILHFNKPC